MSFGERSCKFRGSGNCPEQFRDMHEAMCRCNVNCPSYVSNGQPPDSHPHVTRKVDPKRCLHEYAKYDESGYRCIFCGRRPQGQTLVKTTVNAGRNDLCPCGSGKKFKKCCGGKA